MLHIIVTGKIVKVEKQDAEKGDYCGVMRIEETFYADGGTFGRYWDVWVPNYCKKSFERLCKEGSHIGIESDYVFPTRMNENRQDITAVIGAKRLFLL